MKIFKSYRDETLIGILAIAAYLICLLNDFHTDDWIVLSLLRDGFSLNDFLSMDNPGRFRPLTNVIVYLRFLAFGDTAVWYYILNIILHASVCVFLYRFLLKIDLPRGTAMIASLFFAAYFQHYEAVLWLYGIIRMLAAIFYIAGLWFLHDYLMRDSKNSFWKFVVVSFLGLFIVEDFVVAPIVFTAFTLLLSEKGDIRRKLKPVILTGIFCLAIYFVLRSSLIAHPEIMEKYYYPGFHIIRVFFEYIGWFIIPSPAHSYFSGLSSAIGPGYPVWRWLSYVAILGFVPLSIWLYLKSPKQVRFFILFMYISLLPILPLKYKVGPRNIYLPSLGLAVAVGSLFLNTIWNRVGRTWLKRGATVILIIYLAVSIAAINITATRYRKTQSIVAEIVGDLERSGVDLNDCRYVLLDHVPGRAIIGPAMMYKLHYKRFVIASNSPIGGPLDIKVTADSLCREGIPVIVFDYRGGHMVEATGEYINLKEVPDSL